MKTVIITGGGSGIGLETAKLIMESNRYKLILLGRNQGKLEAAVESLGGTSENVSLFACDLRDPMQIEKTIKKIARTHDTIYGLINNAGIEIRGNLMDTSESDWDETMGVNLKAPFLLTQAVVKRMAKNPDGGRIVNISSTIGILPNYLSLAYSVSKAALIHLTRNLAKELGKDNITVNCICPGVVRTSMHDPFHTSKFELEQFFEERAAGLPLGRIGEPRDVAGAVRFFLSEDAAWITGDVLVIDGGRLLL